MVTPRGGIANRLGALGLELHPGKTKVVYCKDVRSARSLANEPAELTPVRWR